MAAVVGRPSILYRGQFFYLSRQPGRQTDRDDESTAVAQSRLEREIERERERERVVRRRSDDRQG